MKVTILVGNLPPIWLAGTEIATYNIAKHLAQLGHDVHIIASRDNGLPQKSIEEGFCVHRIKCYREVRLLGPTFFWLQALLTVREIRPDIFHIQDIGNVPCALLAQKLFKMPFVVWGQGNDVYRPGFLQKTISKLALENANAVIALTDDMKRVLQTIHYRDIYVIPNGINIKSFETPRRYKIRRKLQLNENEKLIIFVGRFRPEKGLQYLICAMQLITEKYKSARLILVGEGPEITDLQHLIKQLNLANHITFAGKVSNEEVPDYLAASDVFILPSLSESFGIVNLEAMASGLPIVATRVGGIPEIVNDGENGLLVDPKNPQQIAEKVLRILNDDQLRERLSQNNKEKARQYDWGNIVEKLQNVYKDIGEQRNTQFPCKITEVKA